MRGSGGVGFLIKETCLRQYEVEILDDEVEDVLWIRMQDRSGVNDDLTVAVYATYHRKHPVMGEVWRAC